MKHSLRVTIFLMLLFFTAQVIGLFLINRNIKSITVSEEGIEVIEKETLVPAPELEGSDSFTYILSMILIGTALLLGLIKFRLFKIWKLWFFLAIWGALSISFFVIIPNEFIVFILALLFAFLKLYKPNVIIHNFTEVFMYGGIAVMIAPLFTVFWAVMMLLAISIYDAIAVWKSKHMIKLAKAQADSKMFAGLLIPYSKLSSPKKIKFKIPKGIKGKSVKTAILGGGDIAFPLIFTGSVMTWLIENGLSRYDAFLQSIIISITAAMALFLLLIKGEKNKFYPAMPIITAGCLIGYGIIFLMN